MYILTHTHIYIYIFKIIYIPIYIYLHSHTHTHIYIHQSCLVSYDHPPGQLRPLSHWKLAAHKQGILAKQQGTILAAGHHSITHRCSPGGARVLAQWWRCGMTRATPCRPMRRSGGASGAQGNLGQQNQ